MIDISDELIINTTYLTFLLIKNKNKLQYLTIREKKSLS